MDVIPSSERLERAVELVLAAVVVQDEPVHLNPSGKAALLGRALVGKVVVTLTHANDLQARDNATSAQGTRALGGALGQRLGYRGAPQKLRHQRTPPDLTSWVILSARRCARGTYSSTRSEQVDSMRSATTASPSDVVFT